MNIIALDTETTGVLWKDVPFAVSMWGKDIPPWEKNYYDWRDGRHYEREDAIRYIKFYIREGYEFVFHNAKFDLRMLGKIGLDFSDNVIHDTHCLAHLLDEHQDKKLKSLARTHLGVTTDEEEVLKVVRRELKVKKEDGYSPIPRDVVEPYAIKDAEFTHDLFFKFFPIVKANPDLYQLYQDEMELTRVLMAIEDAGIGVNQEYVHDMLASLGSDVMRLTNEAVAMMRTPDNLEPNPNSTPQIMAYFDAHGIELDNVQKATLAQVDHPLAAIIVELREKKKLRETYFKNIKHETVDGVLHPNFRQHGTVTGRMSSGSESA